MRTLIPLLFIFAGCGASVSPYARASAGHIGCPAEAIELSHVQRSGGSPQSWVANCGRAAYACSSNADPTNPQARIVCSEFGRPHRAAYWQY
jgi:hypothetical protein